MENKDLKNEIGFVILKYRRKAGLTQEQLAAKLHVNRRTVACWETGKSNPKFSTIKEISYVLDIPENEF